MKRFTMDLLPTGQTGLACCTPNCKAVNNIEQYELTKVCYDTGEMKSINVLTYCPVHYKMQKRAWNMDNQQKVAKWEMIAKG